MCTPYKFFSYIGITVCLGFARHPTFPNARAIFLAFAKDPELSATHARKLSYELGIPN